MKKKLTLTAGQIHDLSRLAGKSALDEEIAIVEFQSPWHSKDAGGEMPPGLYAYFTEYPEKAIYGPLGRDDEVDWKSVPYDLTHL